MKPEHDFSLVSGMTLSAEDWKRMTKNRDIHSIIQILDQLPENIVNKQGDDLIQIKTKLAYSVFCIIKIFEQNTVTLSPRNPVFELFEADSIGSMQQCIAAMKNELTQTLSTKHAENPSAIEKAVCYVHKNYNKKITQAEVAKSVYLSPSYFSQLFRETQGICFSDYVNHIRINQAKELLQKSWIKPEDIYRMVGYISRSYYIKMFRKHTGATPSEYRKNIGIKIEATK